MVVFHVSTFILHLHFAGGCVFYVFVGTQALLAPLQKLFIYR